MELVARSNGASCLTLGMPVEATRIKQDSLSSLPVDLDIAIPQISMAQRGFDTASAGLQRPEKAGDHSLDKLLGQFGQGLVLAVHTLCIGYVVEELTSPEFLPAVGPFGAYRGGPAVRCLTRAVSESRGSG